METKYLRDRRKPTPTTFEDAGLSLNQTEPIQSINTTDTSYNFTNNATLLGDGSDANPYSDSDVLGTVLAPLFLVVFCIFAQRASVPSSQYHRGEMIRRQAERVWAIQRVKDERQAIPTETRKEQIEEGLRRMKIVSKCSKTGHCVLGEIEDDEQNETKHDDNEPSTAADDDTKSADENIDETDNEAPSPPAPIASPVAAVTSSGSKSSNISCPESPGRTERKPLLSADSEDSEDNFGSTEGTSELSQPSTNNGATTNSYPSYDFEDDEDVCPICLDNFEVEDTVMFSRHNEGSCAHVFHEECLLQWLLEQRENECPTCRACFIADLESNSIVSSSSSTADTNENSILESDEEITSSSESNGDIEEGNSGSENTTHDETNTGGDSSFDLDEMQDENDDGEGDEKDTAIDDAEEDFTYIIVKGSVQRLPSSHDS